MKLPTAPHRARRPRAALTAATTCGRPRGRAAPWPWPQSPARRSASAPCGPAGCAAARRAAPGASASPPGPRPARPPCARPGVRRPAAMRAPVAARGGSAYGRAEHSPERLQAAARPRRARLRVVPRPYAALISSAVRTPGRPPPAPVLRPSNSCARDISPRPSVIAPRARASRCGAATSRSSLARRPAGARVRLGLK